MSLTRLSCGSGGLERSLGAMSKANMFALLDSDNEDEAPAPKPKPAAGKPAAAPAAAKPAAAAAPAQAAKPKG